MVKLMQWWLTAKPNEAPAKSLLELVRERRILKMREPPDKQVGIPYVSLTDVFSHTSTQSTKRK